MKRENEIVRPVVFAGCWYLITLIMLGLVVIAISPASAAYQNKTLELTEVSSYNIDADDNWVIYEILVTAIPMGKNQTHYLNYNGAEFILTVGTYQDWYIYHNFDISLEYPNGTIANTHQVWMGASSGTYTLDIQPVFYHAQSVNLALSVWVNVGLDPLLVEFNTLPADVSYGNDYTSNYIAATSAIPFTSAAGTIGEPTNIYIYQISEQDFIDHIQNYDPIYGWAALSEDAAQWVYEQVVNLINSIPVIGPLTLSMMELIGTVGGTIIFWLRWFLENVFLIIAGGEVMIAMAAVIMAKKDPDGTKTARLFVKYNISCVYGFLWLVDLVWNWMHNAIRMIAAVVQALRAALGI